MNNRRNTIRAAMAAVLVEADKATCEGRAHVFVSYSGHINGLSAYALPTDTDYQDHVERHRYFDRTIYMDDVPDTVVDRLDALCDIIRELNSNGGKA